MGAGIHGPNAKQARSNDRKSQILQKRDNFVWEHKFTRTCAKGLTVWTQDGTDANNIGSGFDQVFKAVADAGTGTANSFSSRMLLEIKTTASANDATHIQTHTVAGTPLFSRASGPSLNNGNDIWVTWIAAFHNIANVDAVIGVVNASGAAGTTSGAGTPATGTDVDYALFTLDTSLSPNLQVNVSTGSGTGSLNYLDLGFVPTADQVYALTLKFVAASGAVEIYIDGKYKATHGTAFRLTDDSGDAVTLSPYAGIETLTTAAKTVEVGDVIFEIDRTT